MLLRNTCDLAAEILDGKHDEILDYIEQAARSRRRVAVRALFRPGSRVVLRGTRNPRFEGREGTVTKVNPKTVNVDVDRADSQYPDQLRVPPSMLRPA